MKTKLYLSILFCLLAVSAWAQTYKNTYNPKEQQGAIRSQQLMSVNAYNGTVYEPFSNTTPSEQSVVGAAQETSSGPNRAKKDFVNPSDPGHQSDDYPLGDAALPLLLMSLAFAGVIYFRKGRARE